MSSNLRVAGVPRMRYWYAFGGAGVLEIVENFDGDTYRAVYTVKFRKAVYVLHCFQKKSKHGIKTPQQDMDLIKQRLRTAEEDYKANYEGRP